VLPPASVFEAVLEDVSRADTRATRIAETRIDSPPTPPIACSIPYDPSRIDPKHRYVVRARTVVGQRVLFVSESSPPVLAPGRPSTITWTMRRTGGGEDCGTQTTGSRTGSLAGSSSRLAKFTGGDGRTLTADDRATAHHGPPAPQPAGGAPPRKLTSSYRVSSPIFSTLVDSRSGGDRDSRPESDEAAT
jgi:hypothetical protein